MVKMFEIHLAGNRIVFRILKVFLQLSNKISNLIKLCKIFDQMFHKRRYTNGEKYLKRCSASFITKEMHIKAAMRYHFEHL